MHDFTFRGQKWAVILGTWESPDEYRLWGAWKDDPSVTGYNEWIRLREVDPAETRGSKRPCQDSEVPSEDDPPRRKHTMVLSNQNGEEDDYEDAQSQASKESSDSDDSRPLIERYNRQHLTQQTYHGINDGEQFLPTRGLRETEIKPTPQFTNNNKGTSSETPNPPGLMSTQQGSTPVPKSHSHRLEAAHQAITSHVVEQSDANGFPIITSSEIIPKHLKVLRVFARQGDEAMFNIIYHSIDHELAKLGLPALPRT